MCWGVGGPALEFNNCVLDSMAKNANDLRRNSVEGIRVDQGTAHFPSESVGRGDAFRRIHSIFVQQPQWYLDAQ